MPHFLVICSLDFTKCISIHLRIDKGSPCSALRCSHNCNHYNGIIYIFGKATLFSIQNLFYFKRLEIMGLMNLKSIVLLLFLEH